MNRKTIIGGALGLALLTGLACGDVKPPEVKIPTSPPPNGDPTPGGDCKSSSVGHKIVINGKTYVCKEPRPYKWREE